MGEYKELKKFLKDTGCFIEVEGKPERIDKLVDKYNESRPNSAAILPTRDYGVIKLEPDANKRGLEYRVYVKEKPPSPISGFKENSSKYRKEYRYRLNDNETIKRLLEDGFNLGLN